MANKFSDAATSVPTQRFDTPPARTASLSVRCVSFFDRPNRTETGASTTKAVSGWMSAWVRGRGCSPPAEEGCSRPYRVNYARMRGKTMKAARSDASCLRADRRIWILHD